jgi:hypothetical protein
VPDPVSWLQIGQGWRVVCSDGVTAGTVAQVQGDKQAGIFDGLAIEPEGLREIRYVPSEHVGAIYTGEVTLELAAADLATLEPYEEPPPVTVWRPEKPPLSTRIANWFRGRR